MVFKGSLQQLHCTWTRLPSHMLKAVSCSVPTCHCGGLTLGPAEVPMVVSPKPRAKSTPGHARHHVNSREPAQNCTPCGL